jgi:hypothetical protein
MLGPTKQKRPPIKQASSRNFEEVLSEKSISSKNLLVSDLKEIVSSGRKNLAGNTFPVKVANKLSYFGQ